MSLLRASTWSEWVDYQGNFSQPAAKVYHLLAIATMYIGSYIQSPGPLWSGWVAHSFSKISVPPQETLTGPHFFVDHSHTKLVDV